MTTMFNATLQLANTLAQLRVSTATGGTTATLLDTKRTESDDAFNGGTVWLITDVGGSSAAPEGEWPLITDFANTGGVVTATFTAAPASGDTYGIASGDFPLDVLISSINNELVKHNVIRYDRTSLDIVANQSEYTLPTGIRQDNLINVYEETNVVTSDSNPVALSFEVQTAATGSQQLLVIESKNVTTGNDIMLEYRTKLAPLYLSADVIDDSLPMARILANAAAHAHLVRMQTYSSGSDLGIEAMKMFREDARLARLENQIRLPAKRGRVNEAAGD